MKHAKHKNRLMVFGSLAVVLAVIIWIVTSINNYDPETGGKRIASSSNSSQVSGNSSTAQASSTNTSSNTTSTNTSSTSTSTDPASVPAGTTETTDNSDGTQTATFGGAATYTITGAQFVDTGDGNRVLQVTYNVTNLSGQEIPIGTDMDLYAGGTKMSYYGGDSTIDTLGAGASYQGAVQYFNVTSSGTLTLQIVPLVDLSQDPATITLNVSN